MRLDVRTSFLLLAHLHLVGSPSGSLRGEDRDALGERAARRVLRDGQAAPRGYGGKSACG